ncbi:MAG: hypothetical protein M3280_09575 [Actinomycetota bacterium]|nr:hypothetical protein [Actinomycetota bacterium]
MPDLRKLEDLIDQLHQQALDAIQESRLLSFREVSEVYTEALLAYPKSWKEFGRDFEDDLARGQDLVSVGPIDRIVRCVYAEIEEALKRGTREIMDEAIGLPFSVLLQAADLRAPALEEAMLQLLVYGYVQSRSPSTAVDGYEMGKISVRYLFEYVNYSLGARLKDGSHDVSARKEVAASVNQSYRHVARLIKEMIEAGDLSMIKFAVGEWDRGLAYWEPTGSPTDDNRTFDAKATITRLDESRLAHRFVLYYWALRRGRERANPTDRSILDYFASGFRNLRHAQSAMESALSSVFDRGSDLSHWILSELPEGEAHMIGTDMELIRGLLTFALLRQERSDGFKAARWMIPRAAELPNWLGEIAESSDLRTLYPEIEDWNERCDQVRQHLEEAIKEQRHIEEATLINASLSNSKITAFKEGALRAWREKRTLPNLLIKAGSGRIQLANDQDFFGIRDWLPKDLFVSEFEVAGAEGIAEYYASSLVRAEDKLILESLLSMVVEAKFPDVSLMEQLLHVLTNLRTRGYKPSALLIPMSWQLQLALELDMKRNPGERSLKGHVEGIPVYELWNFPSNKICLVDLSAVGTWTQFTIDGEELFIRVEDFDHDSAISLAKNHPSLFASTEATSLERRVREIQSRVHVAIEEKVQFQLVDADAASILELPPDLADDAT